MKLLIIPLRVMRCSCEKCGVSYISNFLSKWVGQEPKNRCLIVGNYLAIPLVRGETTLTQASSNLRSGENYADEVRIYYNYLFVLLYCYLI